VRSGDFLTLILQIRIHHDDASRRYVRLARAYLQVGLSPMLDWRPLTRLARPSSSLLLLRPGVEGAKLDVEVVRCFGVGSILVRRLLATLGGRAARRAAGLSSVAPLSASSSAIGACRLDAGVEERGVDRIGSFPLAGVAGDCIGLARERLPACAGVVDPARVEGGGERADERLNGLRTGMDDWRDSLLSDRGGVSCPFLHGEGVVRVSGLKL